MIRFIFLKDHGGYTWGKRLKSKRETGRKAVSHPFMRKDGGMDWGGGYKN